MAATKAGPRSGIPTSSSRFGYAGGKATPTPATGVPNGGLVASPTPKSYLAFNPNRKPVSGRAENSGSSEGLQQVGRHNGYPDSLPMKADVYIKLPNSTPNSRLNSPVNAGFSGFQMPSKDKPVNIGSKLQYSSQLHDLAKRREQSSSPKTLIGDQEPVNDAHAHHISSVLAADKKRHSSDSTANRYKVKQNIPSPLRESNKVDTLQQHNSTVKPWRGNSPHSALMKQDRTLSDNAGSAFQKFDNRQLLRQPEEKSKRLSSGSSGSDDAVVSFQNTAFHKLPARAESLRAPSSQQKTSGIPQAFSPPPKANTDDIDGLNSKLKMKPQHHVLPMPSTSQVKPDNNLAYGIQPQRSFLPRSNANQNNMSVTARATSPPHIKPNMLPRVIKMKNSNQGKSQDNSVDSRGDVSYSSEHSSSSRLPVSSINGDESIEKSIRPFKHDSVSVTTSETVPNHTAAGFRYTSNPADLQPPAALMKTNLLEETNDTDSYVSETGSESTAATVVMGKKSSIADLTSLDSSSPSRFQSSGPGEEKFPQLSPPLNPEEFPPYFSHDTKFLGKLQNMGFDTGSKESSPTLKNAPQNVVRQEKSGTEQSYSEEDVVTALDSIVLQSDRTRVPSSSNTTASFHGTHSIATPHMRSLDGKSGFHSKDADAYRDTFKTMSLPATARYDGLSRFGMKRDKLPEQVSPDLAEPVSHDTPKQKKNLRAGGFMSGKRERNKTIAFSREFIKPSEDKGTIKPLNSGLKYYPSGRSEQNLASAGKLDIAQMHSNLRMYNSRAISPPHTMSGGHSTTVGLDTKKDSKSNSDTSHKKTLSKKTTEPSSDEKEPIPIKPIRSDLKIMDYSSSPSLRLKSPPHSAFKLPLKGSATNQPDRQQVRSPVRRSMIPSPLSPTSPVNFNSADGGKTTMTTKPSGYDSRLERSISPPRLTQGLLRYHNMSNPNPRKSFDTVTNLSSSAGLQGRARSLSPLQTKEGPLSKDPLNVSGVNPNTHGAFARTNPFKKIDLSAYNNSNKSSVDGKKESIDVLLSSLESATVNHVGDVTGNSDVVCDVSGDTVEETCTESVGVLQAAMLTDLPQALDDVQRVEISEKHSKAANTDDSSPPQSDQSLNVLTGMADQRLPNNVVTDDVVSSVDNMGTPINATAASTHSSIDRSQNGETVVTEQEATSVSSPQLNVAAVTKQKDDGGDADIISDILKQLPLDLEAQGQSEALADDGSDISSSHASQVSDRSRASNFSFRMKPYMPAHVIEEESYLEKRWRESFNEKDTFDSPESDRSEIKEVKRLTPELQRRIPPSKRANLEFEKPSLHFQSDPNLDLRRSDSRSPPYLERYTPENQFRDSELQELHKLISSYDRQVNAMKYEIDHKNKLLMSYERNMSDMSSKLQKLSANLEDKNAEILQLQEEKEKWPAHKRHSSKKSEDVVLSDGCLSDTGVDQSHSSTKKKRRPWRHISLRRKRNPNLTEPMMSPQVPRKHADGQDQYTPSSTERGKLISQLISLRDDLNLLKTENALLKSPSDISSKLSNSAQSLTNSSNPNVVPEPLLVEVKPIQVHVDYSAGVKVKVTVQVGSSGNKKQDHVLLGIVRIIPECNWPTVDQKIYAILEHHLSTVDSEEKLGLSTDSILYYTMNSSVQRVPGCPSTPHCSPYYALDQKMTISVILRGASQGSCDVLAYHVLINERTLQSYVGLLLETKCLILMGTKGSCKTSLANYLGKHLVFRMSEQDESRVMSFNVATDGHEKVIDCLRNDIANSSESTVLVLDDVSQYDHLESILTAAALIQQRPYIIAVFSSGLIKGDSLHHLLFNHQVRVVTCSPDTEPIKNVLARSLRKNVLCLKNQHSLTEPLLETIAAWLPTLLIHLNNFIAKFHFGSLSLGPRVFLNCPLNSSLPHIEMWFINLWNHFIIPYLTATTLDGIKQYGVDAKVEWVDVRDWMLDTYPWKNSSDMKNLNTVTREDVGFIQALRQQKQSSPVSAGSQQSLQDSSKPSHHSSEELPVTPLHSNRMESML